MKTLREGALSHVAWRLCAQTPLERLVERIISVTTVLSLTCLCVGLLVHILGRYASNDLLVARVGAWILVIGILLVVIRVSYWIAERLVRRGLESMTSETESTYRVTTF